MSEGLTPQEQYDRALAALPPKQQRFVEEYLACLNASEAGRRAKYTGKANVIGPRLLANVSIRAVVDLGFALHAMPAPEVLYRLADHARGDMSDFLTIAEEDVIIEQRVNGTLTTTETVRRQIARLDLEKAAKAGKLHLIKSYSLTDRGHRAELYDAHAAQALLAKIHGLPIDRTELSGPNGGPIEIDDVRDTLADKLARRLGAGDAHTDTPDNPGVEPG